MKKILTLAAALFAVATSALADLYVTPTGAGNKDGSSWANAFAGIQAAVDYVDAAVAADANYPIPTIHVADGTYSRVSITRDMALDVRSVNGASATVIDGAGTNACVSVILGGYYNYGQSPKFTGFTLRNGNVRGQIQDCGGGAQGGSFVDCIIEDCQAWRGGGAYGANTMRSIIRRCSAPTWTGGIVFGGNHVNDLMYGCSGNSGLIYGATLYNCTVANNTASGSYYDFLYNSTIRNCILWGNTVNGAAYAQDDASDPKFVGGGDYRLRAGSPSIDSGDNDYADEQYVGTTDLAGNDRVQNTTIDRGCYEAENGQGLEGVLVLASAEGNGTVSPAHSFVNIGSSVTITADTSTWHRDVTTWKTNGVTVVNATGNSFTFTATGEQIDVVAQFATLDWFVNGTTGSDTANNGRTASTAFKTIQHAIDCAAPEEQIFVAAGTYAPIDASRANVAIIGDGRDTTVIDGGGTARCADLGERNFSHLQGFTLRNGRHMNVGTTPGQNGMGTHPAEWAFYGAFRGSGLQNDLYKSRTEVQFDAAAGLASWYIRVVDAAKRATGDGECWPDDPDAGVLNPNVTVPEGEGYITYRVRVREDAPGNARIDNSATIVFDYNDPIVTDPAWWNTVYEIATVPVTIDGETTELSLVVGEPYGELPTPAPREGWTFVGWFSGPGGTGRQITSETIVQAGDRLYGYWKSTCRLYDDVVGAAPTEAATEYNGYLVDAAGALNGTIQVKVGKPNKKTGLAAIKATVVPVVGRKISLKGAEKGTAAPSPLR